MKKTILLGCLNVMFVFGQNDVDVLRFSQTDFYGTARTEAMAGSFGALGADFSAIQINPAGMGRFSSSQFTLNPVYTSLHNQSVYNETSDEVRRNSPKLGTLGAVFTNDISYRNAGRLYQQLAIGYTRLQNFDNTRVYQGQNFNSLLDVFANDGAGIPIENEEIFFARPFSTGLGLDTETIFYDPNSISYFPNLTTGDMYHERTIRTSGGIGEYHIGWSENFLNQLYYGVSLGIRRVNFEQNITHREELLEPEGVTLRSFEYFEDLTVSGTGWNLKGGFIYLPNDELRMGLSIETPSFINLQEEFTTNMIAVHDFGTVAVLPELIPFNEYAYRLRTPLKLRGSLAYIFDNRGALNIDMEYVNYGGGRLRSHPNGLWGNYAFTMENDQVRENLRPVLNSRIGGELMISQHLYLRGGYGFHPQPFTDRMNYLSSANHTLASGIGWEKNKIAIDFSYRRLSLNQDYFAFDPSQEQNRTLFTGFAHTIVLSMAIRF